ncbi:MAG: GGDEF domain-containing protein [Pseudomonadota bacterium]
MSDSSNDLDGLSSVLEALGLRAQDLDEGVRAALERLASENQRLRGRLGELESDLEEAQELADRDVLCPVLNRRAFTREIEREIALADRRGTDLSLLFLDLDNFKQINDQLGHKAGDDVLKAFASALVTGVRRTDIVGRLGGDEFGVLLIEAAGADAERQFSRLSRHLNSALSDLQNVSVSIGLSDWWKGETVDDLLAAADKAMFLKKSDKRV